MMIMIIIILLLFSQSLEGRIPVSHEISLDHGNKTVEFLAWLFLPLNLCLFGQRNYWTDGIGVTMYCFDIYSYNNDCDLIDQIHCKSIKFRVVTKISSCRGKSQAVMETLPPPTIHQEVFELQLLPFSKRHYRPKKEIFTKGTAIISGFMMITSLFKKTTTFWDTKIISFYFT